MIPQSWTPHHRSTDGELVGYLVPDTTGGADGRVVPVTVFGYPLAEAGEPGEAESVLDGLGLSILADRWSLTVTDGEPIPVRIVEASSERVLLTSADISRTGSYGRADLEIRVPDEVGRLRHLG